jgi:hypothetical protein
MHPSELQPGDIICFHTTELGVPEHVAMYTGMIGNQHYITHSVTDGKPGLKSTVLKNIGQMDIFRPRDKELGERAAKRLLAWSKYHIPYDDRRRKLIDTISNVIKTSFRPNNAQDKETPMDHLLKILVNVARIKFYERIKYAARRDTCPVKMLDGVQPRGWHCVQAVILAYQVEELAAYVKTIDQIKVELEDLTAISPEKIKETWISDKHCPEEILETYILPDSYIDYVNALRSKFDEFPDFVINDKRDVTFTHQNYHPCLVAWDFSKEPSIDKFIDEFDSCLNLPAKFCFTDSLFAFMNTHPQHWIYLGKLDYNSLPSSFSTEEKVQHRNRMSSLELETLLFRNLIFKERTLSSPSLTRHSSSPRLSSLFESDPDLESTTANEKPKQITVITSPLIERKFLKKI